MEIQTQPQNQELTVRQQTLSAKIAKVGKLTDVSFARKAVEFCKIKQMDLQNQSDKIYLQQGLSMIFTKASNLIGLKDPISNINKMDIVEMILSRYRSLSLEEIDYAFRLDRYSGDPVPHFQLFNAEYVAKVLNRYRNWLRDTRANNNLPMSLKTEKPKELSEVEKELIVINGAISCFEEFKNTGEVPIGRLYIYDFLYEKGLLPAHTLAFREKIKRKAIKEIFKSREKPNVDRRELKSLLHQIQVKQNQMKVKCKLLVLQEYFHRLQATGKSLEDALNSSI